MPIKICPHCKTRYVIGFDTTDFVHQCNSGNLALDEEDVVITGDWQDFSGSGTRGPQEVMLAGQENTLFGTRAGVLGRQNQDETVRGNRVSTHRQRQYFKYIEDIKENEDSNY